VAVRACDFFIDVFKHLGADKRRKPWCSQHTIDDRCSEAGGLMVSLEYGPGRASTEPKRLGLLIECEETLGDECIAEFPDLVRLSRF
jgi:hypothetical protein